MFDATLNVGQRNRRQHYPSFGSKHSDRTDNMQVPFVCMWLMIVPAGTKRSPGVGTVLAHSLWRRIGWTYILFCCDDDGSYCSVDSTHWSSVDLVPGRRRRRWIGIESALGLFLLFAGDQIRKTLHFT